MSYCTQNVEAEYIDYLENEYVTKEGSTIITRDNGNDSIEEKCPSCGNWYKKIGVHWVNGSCSIPPISEKKYQMIVGLIMGDGCINNGNKNCFAQIYNSNITFLKYLDEVFGWLSNGI